MQCPWCLLFPLSTCLLFINFTSQSVIRANSEPDNVITFNALPSKRIAPTGINSKAAFFKLREEERRDTLPVSTSLVDRLSQHLEGVKAYGRSTLRSSLSLPSHLERLTALPASSDKQSDYRPLMQYSLFSITRQDKPKEILGLTPRGSPTNVLSYFVSPNNQATEERVKESHRGYRILPSGAANDVFPDAVENLHERYIHTQFGDRDGGKEEKTREKDKVDEAFEDIVSDHPRVWAASDNPKEVEVSAPAHFISLHRQRRSSSRLPIKPATLDSPLTSPDRSTGAGPKWKTPSLEFPPPRLRRYKPSENPGNEPRSILETSTSTLDGLQQEEGQYSHLSQAAESKGSPLSRAVTGRLCIRHALFPSIGSDLSSFAMKDLLCRLYLRTRLQASLDPLKRSHHDTSQLLLRHTRPVDNVLDSKSNRWPSLYLLGGAMGR